MKLLTRAMFVTTSIALLQNLLGCDGSNTYSVKTEIIQVDSLDQDYPRRGFARQTCSLHERQWP